MSESGQNGKIGQVKPASRVLVIGLDGATWRLLDPLIESGTLPHLASIVSAGARGVLESTIPPVTASAWSSFYTGRTPGHHGVYDFRRRMASDSTTRAWVSQGSIAGPKIWDIASAQGKTVGLINLPLTFPPVQVNGYMIGGMPVPPARDDIGYPAGLVDEIIRETGGYISDVDLLRGKSPDVNDPGKSFEFVEQVGIAVETRGRAAEYLMDKHPTDLTFAVFVTPDRLSHLFWKVMVSEQGDKPLENWEVELRDKMFDVLHRMDKAIGNLANRMTKDDLIIIMSDHGFGHLDEILKMNRLLSDLGWLKFKPEVENSLRKKVGRILPESVKKPLRMIFGFNRNRGDGAGGEAGFDPYSLIEWEETRAYSGGSVEQGIFLNVAGREPYGTVQMGSEYHKLRESLISELRNTIHPLDEKPLFDWVKPREDVYSGEYLENAPDIIFSLRDYRAVVGEDADKPLIAPWPQPRAGYHRRDGILVMKGPMIGSGVKIEKTGIENVAPTILTCWGLASDKGMDGKLISDVINPEYLENYPERKESFEDVGKKIDPCGQDASDMEDLLKGLGYLN